MHKKWREPHSSEYIWFYFTESDLTWRRSGNGHHAMLVPASSCLEAGPNSVYVLRVEKLSRSTDFGVDDNVRQRFTLALAMNGLRVFALRRQLMQQTELTPQMLTDTVNARKLARESGYFIIFQGYYQGISCS